MIIPLILSLIALTFSLSTLYFGHRQSKKLLKDLETLLDALETYQ